jgi:hypothetical protein
MTAADFLAGAPAPAPAFPVIYRCPVKGCKHTVRRVFTDTRRQHLSGRYPREVAVYGFILDHHFKPWTDAQRYGLIEKCPEHGDRPNAYLRSKPVKGTYSEARVCDARCMGAKGPNCDCQCGGANHGGNYG